MGPIPRTSGLRAPSLLFFSDDWGRHPSSSQHLVGQLATSHTVCWVNTIGTRRPSLDLATLRRGLEKVRHWSRPADDAAGSVGRPRIINPRMWPWFGSVLDRRINRTLLLRQITPVISALPRPVVAVTTLPIVADLMGTLPVDRWVYYCVDDFGQWPGLDQAPLRRMEDIVVDRADVLIAVSEPLRERLAAAGRTSYLLTHGVDLDRWSIVEGGPPPPLFEGLPRPLILFWGVVDRRMDVDFLGRLAMDLDDGTIVLMGPEADPDPALGQLPRLVRKPAVPFEHLPALAREARVLVMPYADAPVTRAMQPLKLKEYLATGLPVVVRDLPSTRPWRDCLDLADSPESFAAAVRARLHGDLPESQRRARGRLAGEGWEAKAAAFERWITDDPAPSAACLDR